MIFIQRKLGTFSLYMVAVLVVASIKELQMRSTNKST
jgi:hypothetical protein